MDEIEMAQEACAAMVSLVVQHHEEMGPLVIFRVGPMGPVGLPTIEARKLAMMLMKISWVADNEAALRAFCDADPDAGDTYADHMLMVFREARTKWEAGDFEPKSQLDEPITDQKDDAEEKPPMPLLFVPNGVTRAS